MGFYTVSLAIRKNEDLVRMKKILLSVIILFVASSTAVAAYHSDFVVFSLIKFSDFEEIEKDIFVSPDTTSKQRVELLELVKNAKTRIRQKFGAFTASPIIISSHNINWRKKYTNNSYADAILLPFKNNKAYIFIGENGHNLDVVAHELVHAEVFSYVGYINQLLEIPIWFNEGIAMQVDFRERYNAPLKSQKELSQLKYGWQFFKGNSNELTAHYSIAKNEVNNWLNHTQKLSLNKFLKKLNNGKNFDDLYNETNN